MGSIKHMQCIYVTYVTHRTQHGLLDGWVSCAKWPNRSRCHWGTDLYGSLYWVQLMTSHCMEKGMAHSNVHPDVCCWASLPPADDCVRHLLGYLPTTWDTCFAIITNQSLTKFTTFARNPQFPDLIKTYVWLQSSATKDGSVSRQLKLSEHGTTYTLLTYSMYCKAHSPDPRHRVHRSSDTWPRVGRPKLGRQADCLHQCRVTHLWHLQWVDEQSTTTSHLWQICNNPYRSPAINKGTH